jgi:hypothetical protein
MKAGMTYIAWRRRLTRQRYARHPLFGFAGKRGLNIFVFILLVVNLLIIETPSTAGEERVA